MVSQAHNVKDKSPWAKSSINCALRHAPHYCFLNNSEGAGSSVKFTIDWVLCIKKRCLFHQRREFVSSIEKSDNKNAFDNRFALVGCIIRRYIYLTPCIFSDRSVTKRFAHGDLSFTLFGSMTARMPNA